MKDNLYAITDRSGDIGGRWLASQARKMYAAGVKHAALTKELVQVWRAAPNGDLLAYDSARTRKLSDHIVAYRNAMQPRVQS
jgi:hypothetical protein